MNEAKNWRGAFPIPMTPYDENDRIDFDRVDASIAFFDGSGVKHPSTAFENHLKLTAPALDMLKRPTRADGN